MEVVSRGRRGGSAVWRSMTDLPNDPGSIFGTHVVSTAPVTQVPGEQMPSSDLPGHCRPGAHRHACRQNT